MKEYGLIAKQAAFIGATQSETPINAWTIAAKSIYPNMLDLQQNAGPKETFLGLCEDGEIKGIPPGEYSTSVANKGYAQKALNYLRGTASDTDMSPDELWKKIGTDKRHNEQMVVVLSLIHSGAINI